MEKFIFPAKLRY